MDPVFMDWAFKGLITAIFFYAVRVLAKLEGSIETLNIRMAVVIEQISSHDRRISKLEVDDKK